MQGDWLLVVQIGHAGIVNLGVSLKHARQDAANGWIGHDRTSSRIAATSAVTSAIARVSITPTPDRR